VDPKQASNSRLNTRMKALWFKGHIKFDINYLNTNVFVYLSLTRGRPGAWETDLVRFIINPYPANVESGVS
jgi:hypothetical protein